MISNVLVTGGAGYIGSHTCKALAAAGLQPVTLDNLVYGHRRAVKWGPLIVGDVADSNLVRDLVAEYQPVGVIHFAAYAYVGESMSDPAKYFHNNVAGSISLLQALNECGVKHVVFSSTCATYGDPQRIPLEEDHPQNPVNPYGESKLLVERVLRWMDQCCGMRFAALRYFNAAGADAAGEIGESHDPETHLIPLAIQAALAQRPHLEVYGNDYDTEDGTAIRDYIHVEDLGEAHVRSLQHLLDNGDSLALNLGTGNGHSVKQVIAAVESVSGAVVPVRLGPRRQGDPPILVADAARAHRILGWKPAHSGLDEIIASAWNWHSKNSD